MPAPAKYVVRLTESQRQELDRVVRSGSNSARKIMRSRVLLMADKDHPLGRYGDAKIAGALGVHANTVARVRRDFSEHGKGLGPTAASRKTRQTPPSLPKLDGKAEATLVAVCCSPAPEGHARWSMSLLADELVRRKVVTSISRETVRKTLKKTSSSPGG